MERIALFYDGGVLYRSSVIVTLAAMAAICGFLSLYLRKTENHSAAFATVPIALALSLLLARLLHWYGFHESYEGIRSALTDPSAGGFALAGAFGGCLLAAELTRKAGLHSDTPEMLDCMSLPGGAAIAVGRLSCLFNSADRGQIVDSMHTMPWVCTVTNSVTGVTEYRFATFLMQALVTGVITAALTVFYRKRNAHYKNGDTALLFLLFYCAAQIVLDSTRYDSIAFHSNGFISIVQVLSALTMGYVIIILSARMVKGHGLFVWTLLVWAVMGLLLLLAAYMEYHVQRHGSQAFFGYVLMTLCLSAAAAITIFIYRRGQKPKRK